MTSPPDSGSLGPDEKLCPFCAETIKAAAVRCRYCHADLSVPEPEADPEPEAEVEPEMAAAVEPDIEPFGPLDPEPRLELSPRGGGRVVLAALVVLCLVLGVALGFLVHRANHPHLDTAPNGQVTQSSFRNAVMSAASDAATQAFSYSYQTFDQDRSKTQALLAPGSKAAKQYAAAMDEVSAQTASAKITQKATVLATGVISAKEHSAKVLLFVNTITTREGSKNQQLKQSRVVMVLTRKDGDWSVTDMTPV